jgi:hypothetical protein
VYLAAGAVLSGFTLTNGATCRGNDTSTLRESCGGGVWCEASSTTVTNCVLSGNAAWRGGGANGGTLNGCILSGNSAWWGGGANGGTLNHCILTGNTAAHGGGATQAALHYCTLTGNSAGEGGGASMCHLCNCVLTGNSAANGGGACCGTLNNCTLAANSADYGGGAGYATTLRNCIVYYNKLKKVAADDPARKPDSSNHGGAALNFCCTTPMPTNGTGNITNEPRFVNLATGNVRLQSGSPCIDAGTNAHVSTPTDLDGRPRILGPGVDMGAYEF